MTGGWNAKLPTRSGGTTCTDIWHPEETLALGYFRCECQPGFSGALCEIDYDECASAPCHNGGTCAELATAEGGTFSCACVAGYSGDECQAVTEPYVPEGAHNPCHLAHENFSITCGGPSANTSCSFNYSTMGITNLHTCACNYGFNGTAEAAEDGSCTDIDECASSPCFTQAGTSGDYHALTGGYLDFFQLVYESGGLSDQGECTESYEDSAVAPGYFNCTCLDGWEGSRCEIDINECDSNPCQNAGTCSASHLDENGPHSCTALDCALGVDPCNSIHCNELRVNFQVLIDTFDCACLNGFSGDSCEIDENECNTNPCQNGGTCEHSHDGEYKCRC
eukprot:COSAG05_NODE_5212_length_1235_cov_1.361796_1_plen_336_part_10